jgi:hypothetical protein
MMPVRLHDVVAQWEGSTALGSSTAPAIHWATRVRILGVEEGSLELEGEREVYFTPPLVRIKAAARGVLRMESAMDANLVARWAAPLLAVAAHAVANLSVLMVGVPLLSPPGAKPSEVEGLELLSQGGES